MARSVLRALHLTAAAMSPADTSAQESSPRAPARGTRQEVDYVRLWLCQHHHRWKGPGGSFGAERIVFDGKICPLNYDADEDDRIMLAVETIVQLGSICAIRAYLNPADFNVPPLVITGV